MTQAVDLTRVTMRFDDFVAVRDVDLRIGAGEFFSFLGPSGCGKTTLLRIVAGFLEPSEGEVRIGDRPVAGLGPNRRPTAMIFQNLALFPLMSVRDNIAFGLEMRGVAKAERRRRADALLELIALPDQGDKKVSELSGGQRQRVAIARALAVEPAVLLLDEPLSALDLKLRQHMRSELRAIQRRTGVTFIYITHDQGEALTMSDRVAVMDRGVIEQVAAPDELYDSPATPFVAGFVGENNRLPGRVVERADGFAVVETALGRMRGRAVGALEPGAAALLFVRPERLHLVGAAAEGDENRLPATIVERSFEGSFFQLAARAGDLPVAVQLPNAEGTPDLAAGATVTFGFGPADAVVLADRG